MSYAMPPFRTFFKDLHGYAPFPWQERLAAQVCQSGWPRAITLPTGSGKTACIDIALFALAHTPEGTMPRRVFYVVDRRLVVDEAFLRMRKIERCLAAPRTPALSVVRTALLERAGDGAADPVRAYELRGGVFCDGDWVSTPLQPALVASTVDQVGSRLLFRGYGVRDRSQPIHAAMVASDALILLDEAHASVAFAQTLAAVRDYRNRSTAADIHVAPLSFVEMTATPVAADAGPGFRLDDADRGNPLLSARLQAPKPVRLVLGKGKREDWPRLARALADEALAQSQAVSARRTAILCNRVRTAQLVHACLAGTRSTHLVTGRMRPLDRDDLYATHLAGLRSDRERRAQDEPIYVVATQSLEVGADLDFDVLVSEVASLDALLQRFGRLNRTGGFSGARGSIVAMPWHLDARKPDPVYGATLKPTWNWLQNAAVDQVVEMRIEGSGRPSIPQLALALAHGQRMAMTRQGPDAPLLLPAHLDALAQTNPRPSPEPEVSYFLHGVETASGEVSLVWRADLTAKNAGAWTQIVAYCPPLAAESLPVRFGSLRRWLNSVASDEIETDADVEGLGEPTDSRTSQPGAVAVDGILWRDGAAKPLRSNPLRPGDTLVLPADTIAALPASLGYIPTGSVSDLADRARWAQRGRVTLRLHHAVIDASWPPGPFSAEVRAAAEAGDIRAAQKILAEILKGLPALKRPAWSLYPDEYGVLFSARFARWAAPAPAAVPLAQHLRDVRLCASRLASATLDPALQAAVAAAADRHDWGKVDPRFQALLRGGDGLAGRFAPVLLAKSRAGSGRRSAGLPAGFRHELLSFLLVQKELGSGYPERDLVLHLVASHHGFCRPFAPVIEDRAPCNLECGGVRIAAGEILDRPPHRLEHEVANRFWSLTRRFGWWGLPFLEAMLRLADWEASAAVAAGVDDE